MTRIDEVQASMTLFSMVVNTNECLEKMKDTADDIKMKEVEEITTGSPQRTKRKEKAFDIGENLNNVVTTLSDDEDPNMTKKHCSLESTMNHLHPTTADKPNIPSAWTVGSSNGNKKDDRPTTVICQSNGKSTPNGQVYSYIACSLYS